MATVQRKGEVKEQKPNSSGPTVLVVEDYDEVRFMISMALRMNGYQVIEATDGLEAVEVARRERPDIILMDLNLPVLDGLAATCRIREQPEMRDVPIVAITAYGTPDYRLKALAAGCNRFMTKPLDIPRLEATVKHLLTEG